MKFNVIANANQPTAVRFAKKWAGASVLALGIAGLSPAMAQDTADDAEIVVTAQKREQSVQDIGLSVTAISGDDLLEKGVDDLEGVLDSVPGTGFYDVSGGGVPVIILRGVGLQNFRINDTPTTAVYVDDVYQTSVAEAAASFFDVERIEVIKGPQGGLYGRNAVGGAIQVISRKPDFDKIGGYVNLGYGRYSRFEGEAALNLPLSDNAAIRVSGRAAKSGDTYFRSVSGNFRHGAEDQWAVRAILRAEPIDNLTVQIKGYTGADKSETPLLRAVGVYARLGLNLVPGFNLADGVILNAGGASPGLGSLCAAILAGRRDADSCETLDGRTESELGLSGRYDSASNSRNRLDNDWWGFSGQADLAMGDYTLTSITAYDRFNHGRNLDYDAVPSVQQFINYHSEIEAWSQELRLSFDGSGPFTWLLGGNYAEDTLTELSSLTGTTGLVPLAFGGLTQVEQPYRQKTRAWASFARADWSIGAETKLILEGRYTNEQKSFVGGVNLPEINAPLTFADDSASYSAFTGKAAFELKPTDNALLYMSISRGFKSGGFFGGFATNNAQLLPFDKETILAYEAGFKTEWPMADLRLNGAVFYYDRQNLQAYGFDTSGAIGINRLTNVGDAETYGAELELAWKPANFFSLQAGMAYVKSEIVRSNATTSDIYVSTSTASFKGARLPNQPEFSANVTARFSQDIGGWGVGFVEADLAYVSEQDLRMVVIPQERAVVTEGARALVDLRLGINAEAGWSVTGFVSNVFDRKYRTVTANDTLGGIYEIYGAPRTWGIKVKYDF